MANRLLALVMALCVLPAAAGLAADWPQFRGPNRDGKSSETGLLKAWPTEGPKLLWKATGCGAGFSSPVIVGDTIYTAGDVDGQAAVVAFTLDGKPKGKLPFAKAIGVGDANYHPGFRSTPTIDGGALFILGADGELVCANNKTLQRVWGFNILQKFGGKCGSWKLAESVLIDGDKLICTPGGPNATIVALDKKTGNPSWTSKGLSDPAAYASCIKFAVGNIPMYATMTEKGVVGVSANTGQFLWRYDRPANGTANCPSPVFGDGRVFEATGYNSGGGQVEIKVAGANVTASQTWETKDMVCHHGGYVLVDGFLYGNHGGAWACLDWKTGAKKWTGRGVGKGCVIYADGMLYCQGEGKSIGLVEAKPDGFKQVSQFPLPPDGKGELWAHPAISNGRLYIRHGDVLFCYDIKAPGGAGKSGPAPDKKD